MNTKLLRTFAVASLAAALILGATTAVAPFWSTTSTAQAQGSAPQPALRTITVVGDGKVNIEPDVARVNIGVETLQPTVDAASAENNAIVDAVLAALQELGIAGEDIQTSGYSVFAERYGSDGQLLEKPNYRVSNTVTVLVRDLPNLGQVLDAAVAAGANNIYGVEFLLDDATAARSAARKLAVANAQATAEELAALNGLQVGKVLSISEVIGNMGGYYGNQFSAVQADKGGGGVAPIQPGQLNLTMQIQITYELVE